MDRRKFVLLGGAVAVSLARNPSAFASRLGGTGIVGDQIGRPVRTWPVRPEQGLEIGDRSLLRAAHAGALVASGAHPVPRLRRDLFKRSMC